MTINEVITHIHQTKDCAKQLLEKGYTGNAEYALCEANYLEEQLEQIQAR